MTSHHSNDEEEKVSNEISSYDNDAQGEINELLNECKILYKTMSNKRNKFQLFKKRLTPCKNILKLKTKLF